MTDHKEYIELYGRDETINNKPTDRENLEWLVFHSLEHENPSISISRGRDLLGFRFMETMREWRKEFRQSYENIGKYYFGQNLSGKEKDNG